MSDVGKPGSGRVAATDLNGDAPGAGEPVTEAEIEDILNSPDMLVEEKQARLEELARRAGYRGDHDGADEVDPLGLQISEALNLLADGGHNYTTFGDVGEKSEAGASGTSGEEGEEPR
jgi:hypothetical protein